MEMHVELHSLVESYTPTSTDKKEKIKQIHNITRIKLQKIVNCVLFAI